MQSYIHWSEILMHIHTLWEDKKRKRRTGEAREETWSKPGWGKTAKQKAQSDSVNYEPQNKSKDCHETASTISSQSNINTISSPLDPNIFKWKSRAFWIPITALRTPISWFSALLSWMVPAFLEIRLAVKMSLIFFALFGWFFNQHLQH